MALNGIIGRFGCHGFHSGYDWSLSVSARVWAPLESSERPVAKIKAYLSLVSLVSFVLWNPMFILSAIVGSKAFQFWALVRF